MKFTPYSQGRRNKTFLGKPKASLTLFGTKVGGIFFSFCPFSIGFCQLKLSDQNFWNFFGVKADINRDILTPCPAYWDL